MATGNPMILGQNNTADHVTYLALMGGDTPEKTYAFRAQAGNKNSHGIRGDCTGTGFGMYGVSIDSGGTGVRGLAEKAVGVHGITNGIAATSFGVLGEATKDGGTGVRAKATTGVAVYATSNDWGVFGRGGRAGVEGVTLKKDGIAVWGHTLGIVGAWAAKYEGPVYVQGDHTVTGIKSAAVPFPDGTLRRLYSHESPESWFEDFGEARVVRGKAEVKLRADFAAVIKGPYHVFLTPHGASNGLYVAARRRRAFLIREQGRGTSSLTFSYRIVAHRRDIAAPRMARVQVPPSPKRPAIPEEPGRGRRR